MRSDCSSTPHPLERRDLSALFREINDEFAARGQPLPVPPDADDERLDDLFWNEVFQRLTEAERAWLRAGTQTNNADQYSD
jgi:hypothetical protein